MPPPAAARDRFFQQSHDGSDRTRPRKQHKPYAQPTTRGDDPFFAASHKQPSAPSARKESEQLEDEGDYEDDDADAPEQLSSKRTHSNKRPESHHADIDDTIDDEDNYDHPAAAASTSAAAHPPKRRKDAPLEMSSKHPTPLATLSARLLTQPKFTQPRDPRFDSLLPTTSFSAHFNAKGAYKFIDELKEAEIKDMKKVQKKVRSQQAKEDIKAELQHVISAKRETERKEREQSALRSWRKQEMTARREGKKPFYLKDRDKKAVKLVSEYARMKDRGQVGTIERKVAKKRRQRAQSDLRSMPRQSGGQ